MSRSLSTGMVTAVSAETGSYVYCIELRFGGGTANYTTAPQTIVATCTTATASSWTALGGALVIGPIQETIDSSGSGAELSLSGVDQTVINLALTDTYLGRVVKIWLVHLEASGAVTSEPALLFSGRMNGRIEIRESGPEVSRPGSVTVSMQVKDMMGELRETRGIRLSTETHQSANSLFASDEFFSFVPFLGVRAFRWGGSWQLRGTRLRWVPA